MTATGKQARKQSGLSRAELHRESHTVKSPAKIKRAGWYRDPTKSTNARRQV